MAALLRDARLLASSRPGAQLAPGRNPSPYSLPATFSAIARAISRFCSAERIGFPPLIRERIVGGETVK